MTVTRYDAARLGSAKRTPQGFLRAPARVTRTGVLTYRRADGSVVRELRRPEHVFTESSLASLADAPVTDLHPQAMVGPTNAKALAVGHVSGASARADSGRYVQAQLVITDAGMISAIEKGDRHEVSCGYTCDLVEGAGVYEGEHYDAEQRNIVYNHVGLGPKAWGRAGSEVALRLDGSTRDDFTLPQGAACALLHPDHDEPETPPKGRAHTMELVSIRLDGVEAQVTPTAAQLVQRTLEARDTASKQLEAKLAELQARVDAQQGTLDETKKQLAAATDPERFELAVAGRLALLDKVRPILGADAKLDGLSPRELQVMTLEKLGCEAKLDGQPDVYVSARFDAALEAHDKQGDTRDKRTDSHSQGGDKIRRAAHGLPPQRASARDILAGRVRLDNTDQPRKYEAPIWRSKLAASRS